MENNIFFEIIKLINLSYYLEPYMMIFRNLNVIKNLQRLEIQDVQ